MTLKVMLVDDELLVRLGIKSLIEWDEHGFTFMGDASDGVKALELMEQEVPDILLTDIVMPRMDGLALIEQVRTHYPDTLIIVLSSHNEFDYVRKAMKLGVEDYILKTSLKPAELLELLVEASGKIARRRENERTIHPQEPLRSSKEAVAQRLRLLLQNDSEDGLAAQLPIGDAEETEEGDMPPGSYLLLVQMQHLREGVPEASALQMLMHLLQSELGDLLACVPLETGKRDILLFISDPNQTEPDPASVAANVARSSSRLLGIELSFGASPLIRDWKEVSRAFAQAKEAMADHRLKKTSRHDIKRLLEYMEEHYAHDLSLKQAAEMINISESYLSSVFKKETGMGFTDCLNRMRVDKSAQLLLHTDIPIYEISLQVGYENINYFGRIFKKIKGVSPQKYRNQFK